MSRASVRVLPAVLLAVALLLSIVGPPVSLARRAPASHGAVRMTSLTAADRTPVRTPARLSAPAQRTSWIPFDPAPTVVLPTTAGTLTLAAGVPPADNYVFLGNAADSLVSPVLWSSSITKLLTHSPDDVHYVFMHYGDVAQVTSGVTATTAWISSSLALLPDQAERDRWATRLHVATADPLTLGGEFAALLTDWGDVFSDTTFEWTEGGTPRQKLTRGATDSGWARSLVDTGVVTGPVTAYGNLACGQDAPANPITGTVALIERGVCPFVEKATNAARHGAKAAVLFNVADRPVATMMGSCTDCPGIPVVLIERQDGLDVQTLLAAGTPVTVTLVPDVVGKEMLAIDTQDRVRAFGNIPFPFNDALGPYAIDALQSIAYEAQYLHYEKVRDTRLRAEEATGGVTRVPVFQATWIADPGWAGERGYADVALPSADRMETFDTLELDLSLGCQDHWRSNCPAWDYIANLYLCEKENPDRCDLEVGRWITPYWAEGRWVTDVSPLLAFIHDGGTRRFAFYTQQRYQVDLALRFSNRGKGVVPVKAYDLGLNGGSFWRDYNARFRPITFEVPQWAERVEVMSTISGHGWGRDLENCAEFCNHTHHIAVNHGLEYEKDHPMAGTLDGCAEQAADGVTPNQSGTWIYGRGGWCPGLDVKPWTIDVTGDVRRGGRNVLGYRGLFNGRDYVAQPDPNAEPGQGFDARIDMRSYVVFWARMTAPHAFDESLIFLPRTLRAGGE